MKVCGDCFNWMKKPLCPIEKRGQKPSCGYPACDQYKTKQDVMNELASKKDQPNDT